LKRKEIVMKHMKKMYGTGNETTSFNRIGAVAG